jgi:hypothetical protein
MRGPMRYELESRQYIPSHEKWRWYFAVAYAVTLGSDFAFFLVSFNASRFAVPSGMRDIWLYTYMHLDGLI